LSINKNTKSTNFEGGPNYGGRSLFYRFNEKVVDKYIKIYQY